MLFVDSWFITHFKNKLIDSNLKASISHCVDETKMHLNISIAKCNKTEALLIPFITKLKYDVVTDLKLEEETS